MMKPLSERIKSFSTDQFIDWLCLSCVDVREVRTEEDAQEEINTIRSVVTERLSALEQENTLLKQGCENNPLVHEMLDWKERAEAAESNYANEADVRKQVERNYAALEAKLAELEKQEPVAYTDAEELESMRKATYADMFTPNDYYKADHQWIPLYARPAPAVSLADLVPPETDGSNLPFAANGWNACRAAILRNIEEQSK